MSKESRNKNITNYFKEFIAFRNRLNPYDKKMEAVRLVEEIKNVDVDGGWNRVNSKILRKQKVNNFFTIITRIAAVATLPLLAFTIWSLFFYNKSNIYYPSNDISWQSIKSPAGTRSFIVLPDGTNVWLNAESIVKYSIPFSGENRSVYLIGEAYFDVRKNQKYPFSVRTDKNAKIEVMGTQFNVNAYAGEDKIEVALKEGEVKFIVEAEKGKAKYANMKVNDYLSYDINDGEVNLANTNIDKYIAWHKNIMILDETPMPKVAKIIERWYGVKVIINDEEINNYKFTTTFDNEPLFRVLELLELSSPAIKTVYIPGKVNKKTNKLTKSIVTISKK